MEFSFLSVMNVSFFFRLIGKAQGPQCIRRINSASIRLVCAAIRLLLALFPGPAVLSETISVMQPLC